MSSRVKFSILVPSYDPELKKREYLSKTLESIEENSKGQNYELIIRKNGPSYVESHNDALATATGEQIIVVTDDVVIKDPDWLQKAERSEGLWGWRFIDFHLNGKKHPDFACWGLDRSTLEKLGFMDEEYKYGVGYEDNDYIERAYSLGVPVTDAKIILEHAEGVTLKTYYNDRELLTQKNKQRFLGKW